MKKIMGLLSAILFLAVAAKADTYTPNFNFDLISTGTTGWGVKLNNNFQIADASITAAIALSTTSAANRVLKAGDKMTGYLTTGSSLTVVDSVSTDSFSMAVTTDPTRGVYHLVVTTQGAVGLGTTAPATLLDVAGSAQFGSGALKSTFSATPGGSTFALTTSSGIFVTSGPIALGGSGFIKFPDATSMRSASLPASSITGGTLPASVLVTTGNVQNGFNGASQLVQVGSDGKLPVLDGSNLTNVASSVISLSSALVVGQSTGGASSWGSGLGYNNGGGGYILNGWTLVGYSTGGAGPITFTNVLSSTSYLIDIAGNNQAGNGAYAIMNVGVGASSVWQVQCSSNDATTRNRGSVADSTFTLTGDALYAGQMERYTIQLRATQGAYGSGGVNPFWGVSWTANTWHDNGLAISETCNGGGGTTTAIASPTSISFRKFNGNGGTWNGTIFVYARRDFISP